MQGGDAEQDELLPEPRSHQDGTRARRLRRDLGVGAVGLLAAALVGSAIARHGGPGTGASPATSSHPHELAAATGFLTLLPTAAHYLPESAVDAVACPSRSDCIARHDVSQPVRDAVADAFPGAVVFSAEAVHMRVPNFGEANWSLQLRARTGAIEIVLRMRGLAKPDRSHGYRRVLFNGTAITRYESVLGPYYVFVEVIGPATQHQSVEQLAGLAKDIRLFEPW
jgi:hypothetical protein